MKKIIGILIAVLFSSAAVAAHHTVDLTVAYKPVCFAKQTRQAIAVNQQIPAPTLHFRQGDVVTINVTNKLDQETALHWHGILLPWQMDGVKGVTQQGIKPGETFKYHFKLEQSGTYWYHSHAGLQEQQGLYGAFIIDPPSPPAYHYSKDYVIVLSDWTNTNPDQVLANLKKDGDYYSPRFPLQASLTKFIHDYGKASRMEKRYLLDDYLMMQQSRMGLYDFSDVAYDAFLLNGKTKSHPWTAAVKVGDVVRLRFIGAGASTIFRVKIPGTVMQMVHVQGNDVQPYPVHDFMIAPGETYDVLVKITDSHAYRIYAESLDTSGAAYGALVTSPNQTLAFDNIAPFPEPVPVTRTMMNVMMGEKFSGKLPDTSQPAYTGKAHEKMKMDMDMPMDHEHMGHGMGGGMHHNMNHAMHMATESTLYGDKISSPSDAYTTSVDTVYKQLKAAVKTNNPDTPVAGVINMELFGYMGNYIWFINGVPEDKAKPIVLQPGKRYRFVFTNTSMMNHPMHIHGHWFILRKGNGAYDPLLHTIDVPPGATITADVDTDASGQWIFHCHLLYHMMSGMTRIFQYSTLLELTQNEIKPEDIIKQTAYVNRPIVRVDEVRPINKMLVKHPMPHEHSIWYASFLDFGLDPFTNLQEVTFKGMYGPDTNKLELFMNDAEMEKGKVSNADLDVFYWHQIYQYWALKGGVNYFYRVASSPYFQPGIGVEGLMPYFIDVNVRGYHYAGSNKIDIDLARDTQITNNFFIGLEVEGILASKTVMPAGIGSGLNYTRYTLKPFYRVQPGLDLFVQFEHESDFGAYKNILISNGESTGENTYTLGFSVVF